MQRLDWMFQPESTRLELREPFWMNQENLDGMLQKLLYNNMDHVWYNKLSYVSALKPILTNDAASDSTLMTLKRQLCHAMTQNETLRNQVMALQKMTGSNSHWKQVWTRAVE